MREASETSVVEGSLMVRASDGLRLQVRRSAPLPPTTWSAG